MKLLPIKEVLEENTAFISEPLCAEILPMSVNFYQKVGYVPPWIGYFAKLDDEWVGSAGFKGPPVNGAIEIAYGTFEQHMKKGIGTSICKELVKISLAADENIKITARTLQEDNFSTKILRKNNFVLAGTVNDPEDGEVWEWVYEGGK